MLIHFFGPLGILIGEVVSFFNIDAFTVLIVELIEFVLGDTGVEQVIEITDELVAAGANGALHRGVWEVPDHGVTGFAIVALD